MESLRGKIQKGAAWMTLSQLAGRGISLVSMVILARLLIPMDFGVVAIASTVIVFLELLGAFGFDSVLIQKQSAERRHYDTAWTFKVLFGVFSAAVLVLLAIPMSQIYHEPRLASVIAVLAVRPLVAGLENIGVVAFRKELTFDREFRFLTGKNLAVFTLTVSLAILTRDYWALVYGVVIGQIVGVVLSYWLHPYRPRFCLEASLELMSFSKWLLMNNFISFFYLRSADLILGKVVGLSALGLYRIAYDISSLSTTELIAPINRAMFPGYAKLSSDKQGLREAFLKVISAVALLALPAAAGMAAVSEILVNVVLGEKWVAAVPLVQMLVFYGAITALESSTYYVHLALGDVRIFTALIGISSAVLVPVLIAFTISAGAIGAAKAHVVVAVGFFPLFYWVLMRKLEIDVWQLLRCWWIPVFATSIMYGILRTAQQYVSIHSAFDPVVQLFGLVILGVSSYSMMVLGLWYLAGRPDGPERLVLDNLAAAVPNWVRQGRNLSVRLP